MATIRELMKTDLVTIEADAPVSEALQLLIDHNISGLPVVDSAGGIVGVLSEKDLLKVYYESDLTVGALMTRDPESFSVDAELVEVVDSLMAADFRRVLIHDKGKLVGLISRADLMPTLLEGLLERASKPPSERE